MPANGSQSSWKSTPGSYENRNVQGSEVNPHEQMTGSCKVNRKLNRVVVSIPLNELLDSDADAG